MQQQPHQVRAFSHRWTCHSCCLNLSLRDSPPCSAAERVQQILFVHQQIFRYRWKLNVRFVSYHTNGFITCWHWNDYICLISNASNSYRTLKDVTRLTVTIHESGNRIVGKDHHIIILTEGISRERGFTVGEPMCLESPSPKLQWVKSSKLNINKMLKTPHIVNHFRSLL